MSTRFLMALGAGLASALAATSFAGGVAHLPLFLVGLGLGATEFMAALAAAIAAVGIGEGPFAAGRYAVFYAVPAFVVTRRALARRVDAAGTGHWPAAGDVLSWLTGFGIVFLIVGWFADWAAGGEILNRLGRFLDGWFRSTMPALGADGRRALIAATVPWIPGTMAATWILATAFNAVLAQAILVRAGRNVRPAETLASLALPEWTSWIVVTAAALALAAPGEFKMFGRNLALVAGVPFLLLGFTVAATLLRRARGTGKGVGWLMAGVVGLSLIFTWVLVAIAALGMAEQWADIRRRIEQRGGANGSKGGE